MARQANALIPENGWGALVVVVATLLQTNFLLHLALPSFNHGLSSETAFNTNHSSPVTFFSLKFFLMLAHPFMLLTPQARLLVSILSSTNLVIPHEAYPLLLRTLYIWVRKSLRPSSVLIDSAVVSLSHLLAIEFGSKKSPEFLSESVLLLGAFSFVLSVSESSKTACLQLLCMLLEDEYRLVSPFGRVIPDVLAGIGYALCSSVVVHNVRILNALLGIWGKEDGPPGSVSHGLAILHLAGRVISAFIKSCSQEKLQIFA